MKMTLLEMTQHILSSMDSDNVNDISDTIESQQVAKCIEQTYNYLCSSLDLPEHYTTFELIASGDVNKPVLMTLPSNCLELVWLKYDVSETGDDFGSNYRLLKSLPLPEFFERQNSLNLDDTEVLTFNYNTQGEPFPLKYFNDRMPSYYTVLEDNTLFFDAFLATEETTLVKAKTQAWGKLSFDFEMDDSFTPNFDAQQHTLLLNEAMSQCFIHLKQQEDPVSMKRARKGWIRTQVTKERMQDYDYYDRLPNYGRR